jgi:hypothetical protein
VRHIRSSSQVALLTSERQLSSLIYNLNLNLNQKIKKSLPNKIIYFKTSNHVKIRPKLKDPLHDFNKTLLTYQSSYKTTILSYLRLYFCTQIPDKKSLIVCLKKVFLSLLILLIYHKESESLTPDLLTRSRTLAQTRRLRNQDLLYKHTTIKARSLFLLNH